MSGGQQMLLGGGRAGPAVNFDINQLTDVRTGTTATAAVAFNTAGFISYQGTASSGSSTYCTPTGAGVGSNFWIRIVINSGASPNGGNLINTLINLSITAQWVWNQAAIGTLSANCTITIYGDAAGALPLWSDSFNVTSQRAT